MTLTIVEVTRIAKDVARAQSSSLEVKGVTLGGGADSGYVEILVNIQGCDTAPCQIAVGTFRDVSEQTLSVEIAQQLRAHLEGHRPAS